MTLKTNTRRHQQTPPVRGTVPPGAQPGMTPAPVAPDRMPQAPPPASAAVYQAAEPAPTGTVLDRLMPLMHPDIWGTFVAIVTYGQLIDDLEAGNASMTTAYRGAMLSPFIGFGPLHVWTGMQGDLKQTLLRIIDRWFMDIEYRTAGGSLSWQFIDWLAPGFCGMTMGEEAKLQALQILQEIKKDFV